MPWRAQEQPPTGVLGQAGSCDHGHEGGGTSGPLRGSSGAGTVWKCWDRSCGRGGSKDLGGARPAAPGWDSVTSPTPGAQCGHRAASPWHGPAETRGAHSTHPQAVTSCGCPAATSPSAPCPPPSLAFPSSPGIVQQERKQLRSLA